MSKPEPFSEEWWAERRKTQEEIIESLRDIVDTVKRINSLLVEINADFIYTEMIRHPEKKAEFIEKLYDPIYCPSEAEEIVIRKLFHKEKDQNG